VKGSEFVKKVKKLGKHNGIEVWFDEVRGRGSHGTLYYGEAHTVVKDRKKEIGPGLLRRMKNDLGIDEL